MTPLELPWMVLLLPLAATVGISLLTLRRPGLSASISIGSAALVFLLSLPLIHWSLTHEMAYRAPWLQVGDLTLEMSVRVDALTAVMLLVVTGVGLLIHVYSIGYMRGDRGFSRYFACLSLFMFSMLGVVLAANYVQIFVFWELVGLSSYLLIGHDYQRPAAAAAGKKAFLVNRIGDFGFILGILLLWASSSTVDFQALERGLATGELATAPLLAAALLVLAGAVAKSAQFPLHVWLPDAMEGPTPVSALIHAATMVAAGVYLLARTFALFAATPLSLAVVAWIGALTALAAALMALVHHDIKKILAYSTLSQLGYMVLAVGLGAPRAGIYHLTTHAFFKALLFLAAGSVIHALHTQDIREMGGLLRRMPITGWTFLVGALALAGVPPLSGFFSKDEILAAARSEPLLYVLGLLVAFLTALYVTRLIGLAFLGEPRRPGETAESPAVMTVPLIVLAGLAALAGLAPGIGGERIEALLHGGLGEAQHAHSDVALLATLAALMGIFVGGSIFLRGRPSASDLARLLAPLRRALLRRMYMEDLYGWLVGTVQQGWARLCAAFDRRILIQGAVDGVAGLTREGGRRIRRLQTGRLQTALLLLGGGTALLLVLIVAGWGG